MLMRMTTCEAAGRRSECRNRSVSNVGTPAMTSKPSRRLFMHLTAVAATLPALPGSAWAQAYPSRPVRWIVGYAPGGATDILARLIGHYLGEKLGQPFVIENRT